MRNKLIMAVALLFALLGCGKDDKDDVLLSHNVTEIYATLANGTGASYVAVKTNNVPYYTIAKTDLINGEFYIKLPETVEDYMLDAISESMPKGLKFSDKKANIIAVSFSLHWPDDGFFKYARSLYYTDIDPKDKDATVEMEGEYFYSDRDVKITGSIRDEGLYRITYNVYLKKGWNIVYSRYDWLGETIDYFGKEPPGLKWWSN